MEIGSIENIVLFVGDAVRFDTSAKSLSDLGQTYKTIAASIHTPASFGSLLTGLNVPAHGIISFQNVIPSNIPTLLEIENMNTAFSNKTGTMHEILHQLFQTPTRSSLVDIEPPFIWVVRDPGGHAPYDGYDAVTYNLVNETGPEYFRRVAGDKSTIKQDYKQGVSHSISRFEDTIETIRQRGLADDTLIIYTSDHGELLGEYGLLGHNHVACPELVYVPTTLVHPALKSGRSDRLVRNIDIVPTIFDLLGRECEIQVDGESIFECNNLMGYNHFEMTFYNKSFLSGFSNEIRSCWDDEGGHVFVESDLKDALAIYLGLLFGSHNGKHIFRTREFRAPLQKLLPGHDQYGAPTFTKSEARSFIERVNQRTSETTTTDLDDKTMNRLTDLGYL